MGKQEEQQRTMAVLVGKLQQSIIRRQQLQQPSAQSPHSQPPSAPLVSFCWAYSCAVPRLLEV